MKTRLRIFGRQVRHRRWAQTAFIPLLLVLAIARVALAATSTISGVVLDPKGSPLPGAVVKLANALGHAVEETRSDANGCFSLDPIGPGSYQLTAEAEGFAALTIAVQLGEGEAQRVRLEFQQVAPLRQAISVVAAAPSSMMPDPTERIIVHDQVLDANPGRPGAPISLPGLPIETASGGIKAPQYFAPGVAGDHGEPIAQFFQVGSFLFPNNLPANAHGNGYADPNVLIPITLGEVIVDGGAFNVREGNHSVDLAAIYAPRATLHDFFQLTGDYRDIDAMAGWSPAKAQIRGWLSAEAAYGNGFLERPEHRQQYKLNGYRVMEFGRHEVTLYGIAYYGFSYVPGLIPIHADVPGDTIDDRQLDRTSNFLVAASDDWTLDAQKRFTFAGFFRDYHLRLRSNFGDGLIQQSETRTVLGGEAAYLQTVRPWLTLLAGVDLRRDAPRDLKLDRFDAEDVFEPVTSNDLTISFVEPFASLDGNLGTYVHYDAGVRQEAVWMNNQDLVHSANSFDRLATLTLPKATLTLFPAENGWLPSLAASYGQAFHTNDPRIGNGTSAPTLLAPSRAWQLRIAKNVKQYQLSATLRRSANSQQLAKIDPDTGLQKDLGPSLNRAVVFAVQRTFSAGAFYLSYAQADARDRETGQPSPEAPRMICDAVGSLNRLPWQLQVRGELEFVKASPLGDGFVGVPVYEVRGAMIRPFAGQRMSLGVNFLAATGYTGQTTETIVGGAGNCPVECAVGVPLKSYVSATWTWYFKR